MFAQNHGWLSKEVDLLALVEKRSEKRAPVEIFTPSELTALLKNASRELAPCLRSLHLRGCGRRKSCAWTGRTSTGGRIHRSGGAQSKDGHAPNRTDPRESRALAGYRATQRRAPMAAQQGLLL